MGVGELQLYPQEQPVGLLLLLLLLLLLRLNHTLPLFVYNASICNRCKVRRFSLILQYPKVDET